MSKINALEFGNYVENCYQEIKDAFASKNLGTPATMIDAIRVENSLVSQYYNPDVDSKYDSRWPDIRHLLDAYDVPAIALLLTDAYTSISLRTNMLKRGMHMIFSDEPEHIYNYTGSVQTKTFDLSKDYEYENEDCKLRWVVIYGENQADVDYAASSFCNGYMMPIAKIMKNFTTSTYGHYAEYLELINCQLSSFICAAIYNFVNTNSSISSVKFVNAPGSSTGAKYQISACDKALFAYPKADFLVNTMIVNDGSTIINANSDVVPVLGSPTKELHFLQGAQAALCLKMTIDDLRLVGSNSLYNGASYIHIKNIENYTQSYFSITAGGTATFVALKFDCSITFNLSTKYIYVSIYNVLKLAEKLEDRTSTAALSWSMHSTTKAAIQEVYVKTIDGHLTIVDSSTEGAITLLQYITNKNWTISS